MYMSAETIAHVVHAVRGQHASELYTQELAPAMGAVLAYLRLAHGVMCGWYLR